MKKFLKVNEIALINGGYLSIKENGAPVTNEAFVAAQKQAEYIITYAQVAKGKNLVGKKVDTVEDIEKEVNKILAEKTKTFVALPVKGTQELTEQLKQEALAFMSFEKDTTETEKINAFLQKFVVLSEFEEFGLFFEDGIVKLNAIYTMEQVIAAVKSVINLVK